MAAGRTSLNADNVRVPWQVLRGPGIVTAVGGGRPVAGAALAAGAGRAAVGLLGGLVQRLGRQRRWVLLFLAVLTKRRSTVRHLPCTPKLWVTLRLLAVIVVPHLQRLHVGTASCVPQFMSTVGCSFLQAGGRG